jgi:uncharacterized protein YggE
MDARSITITLPTLGNRTRWLALGLAAGLLIAGIASPIFSAPHTLAANPTPTQNEHTISVSGTGKVTLNPDIADLRLGVTASGRTVKAVRESAATSMTKVMAALKKLGIADKDIQTASVSLQPTYDYNVGTYPPNVTGYQFSNAVSVTVRDLDKVGDAIDDALAAGATSLDGVTFRVADETGAEGQARTAAMADAKAKAHALATAAGVSITGVASISETVTPTPYPIFYGAAQAAGKDASTPVQPGSTDISITVSVVYLIG